MEKDQSRTEDLNAIKEFLMDIECLDPLSEWTNQLNLFEVLKISRTEIRHSNMLAWLLDPNENHGLGDDVIRRFVRYAITAFSDEKDVFQVLLKDCMTFRVQREYHNIDIFACSEEEKIVLCIENKIDSKEQNNQLVRYREFVEAEYSDFTKLFIYLTIDGDEPSDNEYWCSMNYEDVLGIVKLAKQRTTITPEATMVIENYIEAIRRYVVGDEQLAKICAEIYEKHKKAIDLIIEYKPDKAAEFAERIKKWGKEASATNDIEISEKCTKRLIRFKTKDMSIYLSDLENAKSGWNTPNYYFYEIVNDFEKNKVYIQFVLSSKGLNTEQMEKCEQINKYYEAPKKIEKWQWRTCFKTKERTVHDDYSEEKLNKILNELLQFVKEFEEDLLYSKLGISKPE